MDRTTYMFTYVDPQPGSPKLEELLEDYWNLMPDYQVISYITLLNNWFYLIFSLYYIYLLMWNVNIQAELIG